ncbi:MAG: Asp-tRNA(Asn)/Glu-tRNA(Gln) amidotransferase subunit GatB [Phycisphaerales bacterium]|nr:Asp-tRNA(Asn)/Glu-tRNA(Gln) amidotransferase subunit GatB [Phycisphaerales bacterium]
MAQAIQHVALKVGLEIHVELATRSKVFAPAPSPAHAAAGDPEPNTLIDPVVLGLPGALPVINRRAIDLSILVGLALNCSIAPFTKWDRKSYTYPDLPKAYQISQYDLPLCFDGSVELPRRPAPGHDAPPPPLRVGIIRAHLEEDAGKLLHERPGGGALDHSIADFNRAGTALLEIVTAPDFADAEDVVAFAQWLRNICVFLGVTEGVMQKGHIRFEPNINCILTLAGGRTAATPVVEVKNLNSFKSLRGAIEHELAEQPRRFLEDGLVMGPGAKTTRGWDDSAGRTFLQREKEDAHDYRYFPDPDLPPVVVDAAWVERLRAALPELPHARAERYRRDYGLGEKEAAALTEDRALNDFYEACTDAVAAALPGASGGALAREQAGRLAANAVLQSGFKRANERQVPVPHLGISPAQVGAIAAMREAGEISAAAMDELFGLCCTPEHAGADPRALARGRSMVQVRDEGALLAWVDQAIANQPRSADDVRAGKTAALGRLVGEVMKLSGGKADGAAVRAALMRQLGVGG